VAFFFLWAFSGFDQGSTGASPAVAFFFLWAFSGFDQRLDGGKPHRGQY
jgi:hypothetical protein